MPLWIALLILLLVAVSNGTIDRVVDILEGQGEQWARSGARYRDHVAHEKYQVVKI